MDAPALWARLRREGISPRTLAAMATVPRDAFVPEDLQRIAWEDCALPIGLGQSISQPYVVGIMTDAVDVGPRDVVLDVGTGSGYQAAVLAACGASVHGIERIEELARRARARLTALRLPVSVTCGDGMAGMPGAAPFDGIVVAAAIDHVPPALLDQLRPPAKGHRGGRLVIPLGGRRGPWDAQRLVRVERLTDGFREDELLDVMFVPLLPGVVGHAS